MYALNFDARYTGTQAQTGTITGVYGQIYHTGTGSTSTSTGLAARLYLAQDTGTTASSFIGVNTGGYIVNAKTGAVTSYFGVKDEGMDAEDGAVTSAYNFYGTAHQKDAGSLTNARGIWLEKQAAGGTQNIGIVLDGDSTMADIANSGAGIVFGDGQDAGIGYDGTDLVINTAIVGSGVLRFGTHAAVTTEVVTGYITIKDSAGNVRKLAVVS